MNKFILKCILCGNIYGTNQFNDTCANHNSLLKTEYINKKYINENNESGIWNYKSWLPCNNYNVKGEGPSTYKSFELAKYLNLNNLYISFNGYFPSKGANLQTCSFKDLEAVPTIQLLLDNSKKYNSKKKILVVASAGNTARSFLYICIKYDYPLIIVVPELSIEKLWIPNSLECIEKKNKPLIIAIKGDYADAINFANEIIKSNCNYISEGGAKNIARRDGIGTIILNAVSYIGKLPDHYIQAVGSGTGGIAAYEASKRLVEDGNYGNKIPKIHLIQNIPCSPLLNMSLN